MISITKSAALIAFSFAVLVTNDVLAQSELAKLIEETGLAALAEDTELFFDTEPKKKLAHDTVTVHRGAIHPVLVSTPAAVAETTLHYPSAYPTGIGATYLQSPTPITSTSQLSTQPALQQQPIRPSVLNRPIGSHGFPIGYGPNDVGYAGPGDMRTHLWKAHSADLQANGISKATLMSMPMATVQQWHNYFHGTEGAPNH